MIYGRGLRGSSNVIPEQFEYLIGKTFSTPPASDTLTVTTGPGWYRLHLYGIGGTGGKGGDGIAYGNEATGGGGGGGASRGGVGVHTFYADSNFEVTFGYESMPSSNQNLWAVLFGEKFTVGRGRGGYAGDAAVVGQGGPIPLLTSENFNTIVYTSTKGQTGYKGSTGTRNADGGAGGVAATFPPDLLSIAKYTSAGVNGGVPGTNPSTWILGLGGNGGYGGDVQNAIGLKGNNGHKITYGGIVIEKGVE